MTALTISNQEVVAIIKKYFLFGLDGYIKDGTLTKEKGNRFYITLFECSDLVGDIAYRCRPQNTGWDDQFSGFEFASSDEELARIVEECHIGDREGDETNVFVHSEHNDFSILLVDSYQHDDDYLNYDSPTGEDTWHRTIVFKAK